MLQHKAGVVNIEEQSLDKESNRFGMYVPKDSSKESYKLVVYQGGIT